MIYKCPVCGEYIYPHDFEEEGVCPYCGCTELIPTDEDEQ